MKLTSDSNNREDQNIDRDNNFINLKNIHNKDSIKIPKKLGSTEPSAPLVWIEMHCQIILTSQKIITFYRWNSFQHPF